jgi:hypothetical protein
MKTHSKTVLDSITCPFSIDHKSVNWDEVEKVISTDDKECSVIAVMKNNDIFLILVPQKLYDSIYRSGEENVIEQDLGFNDLN